MDDPTLLEQFISCELPFEDWCHRLHVRVAYLFLVDYNIREALMRFRSSIVAYNNVNSVADNLTSGYHETLTVVWFRLIASRLTSSSADVDSETFCRVNLDLLDKALVRRFYSEDRIVSWVAKREFVEPDLRALPGLIDSL